jgi:hypothetical protein
MTDGMTEAHRYQRKQEMLREEQRRTIRDWIVQQLEQWSLSSYLNPGESDDAKRLAKEIRDGTRGEDRVPGPSTRPRKARASAKSPKRA